MCISELLRALCARKIHNNYDDMNYSKLIAAIDDRIRANGRREITGQTLHDVLEAMVRSLGTGYQVAGVLGPDDDPGEPDQRFAWLASEPGVYRHCGGVSVTELSWLIWGGGQWLVRAVDVPFGASVREWIADAVAEERSRALIAEALLQKGLDKEVAAREKAVADEAKARTDADTALGERVDTEIADREAAVTAEETARKSADAALDGRVTAEETRARAAEKVNADAIAKETEDRKAADAALQAAIDALPPAAIVLTYDLDALELFGGTMAEVAAALEKGAEVSIEIQNADAEFSSPTSVLRVVGYSYTAPDGPLLLHAVSPRYDAAADVQTNFNSVVFKWEGGGNVALYRFTPQAALVSGTNIKTVNGESLLGSGDLAVSGGLPEIIAGNGECSIVFNFKSSNNNLNPSASGDYSVAEGRGTRATGTFSHAEGWNTTAPHDACHAEGNGTIAQGYFSHAEGTYNTGQEDSVHEVGIGSLNRRKDAHRITYEGKHYIPGVGNFTGVETSSQIASGGVKDLATVISELESAGGGGGPFALAFTLGTGDKWSMDCTFEELAAAVDAKRGVIFTVNNGSYDGDVFTATLQLHSSAANVVVLQGYVNKAYIYVVVTNGSTGLTVDVSEVNLVNIDAVIPTAPSNENVPGTKAVKDYVDGKWAPCYINIGQFPEDGGVAGFDVTSGELSPDRVITLAGTSNSELVPLNVFGLRGDPNNRKAYYGCVLSSTGTVVKVTFDLDAKTVTFNGGDI